MINRYDILQSISQGKDGEMSEENADLVHIANDIRRAAGNLSSNEAQSSDGNVNVTDLNSAEKRTAENWAKENGCWFNIMDLFNLWVPGPSGSEADTYVANDGYIYKVNNLSHCHDSIIVALTKFITFNMVFIDSAYTFVGFTGFGGRSIYPIVKQRLIKDGVPATQNEIDCYMAALGFEKMSDGKYQNDNFSLSDILPKNVLKDQTGDFFVIDAEIDAKY